MTPRAEITSEKAIWLHGRHLTGYLDAAATLRIPVEEVLGSHACFNDVNFPLTDEPQRCHGLGKGHLMIIWRGWKGGEMTAFSL